MRRRLLVTGGAGFLGANFVHYWLRTHPDDQVVVLDALTYAGNQANLAAVHAHPGFHFVHGDILDTRLVEELLRHHCLDCVVHFAAESHVDRSILSPEAFLRTNVEGTHSLLRAARAVWLEGPHKSDWHHFHHVSTDEVFGSLDFDDAPVAEDARYAPTSPYAASKAASDHLVRSFALTYGMRTTLSHGANSYGPWHYPEKLIPLLILRLLEGESLPIYGDGLHRRDWLYAEDHARGIATILDHGRAGESYNLGSGQERSNLQVAEELCAITEEVFAADEQLRERVTGHELCLRLRFPHCPAATGKPCIEHVRLTKDRPGHDRRYALDLSKAERELGFRAEVKFTVGLRRTLLWFLNHESWWRSIQGDEYRQWMKRQYDQGDGDSAPRVSRA